MLIIGSLGNREVSVYHPAIGIWDSTTNLNTPRDGHTATLLTNAKVLVAEAQAAASSTARSFIIRRPQSRSQGSSAQVRGSGVQFAISLIPFCRHRLESSMRKPRLEIEGGLYHIITRGNNPPKYEGQACNLQFPLFPFGVIGLSLLGESLGLGLKVGSIT